MNDHGAFYKRVHRSCRCVLVAMFFQLVVGLALISASHQGKSTKEIQAWFLENAMQCNKEHPVTADEMMQMKSHKMPNSENAKCLLACVMRKTNFIDDKENFNVENANTWAGKEFHDEPKRLESAKNIYDVCKKVNEEKVSDGAKGCERAYHLSICLIENAPKMGFPLQ